MAPGRRLEVGPGKTYATPRAAAAAAQSDDVILISAGDYVGDVAVWPQSNLTLCGVGGRARLFANGRYAAGKGIWVIQGSDVVVENVEFHGAKVPDKNGAGIRAEGNGLTLRDAGFFDNENGILGPNRGDLTIERSTFARNGFGDGFSHNVYVGPADRVRVNTSFFHEAKIGHNFKSRAKETRIENSYFMDGPAGTSSYLVNVPNGGVVVLRGNLLQKGPRADNPNSVAFGEEGLTWATNTLELVHNTLASTYAGGTFVVAAAGIQSLRLTANLFAGTQGPPLFNGGIASKVTQAGNVVSTSASLGAPDNIASPDFWPQPGLAGQTVLATVPDPTYLQDSPQPLVLRNMDTAAPRRAGAMQAPR